MNLGTGRGTSGVSFASARTSAQVRGCIRCISIVMDHHWIRIVGPFGPSRNSRGIMQHPSDRRCEKPVSVRCHRYVLVATRTAGRARRAWPVRTVRTQSGHDGSASRRIRIARQDGFSLPKLERTPSRENTIGQGLRLPDQPDGGRMARLRRFRAGFVLVRLLCCHRRQPEKLSGESRFFSRSRVDLHGQSPLPRRGRGRDFGCFPGPVGDLGQAPGS